jgi:uncharacterized membrane protein YhhN
MTTALTVACAVGCAALVWAEYVAHRGLRIAAKLAASAAFVALGGALAGDSAYAQRILIGLVLGAIGDAALLGKGTRMFLLGLVAFLLGHIAYVLAIAAIEPPDRWLGHAGIWAALPIAVSAAVITPMAGRLGSLRIPVFAYVAVISAMVIAAIAAARGHALPEPNRCRLLIGACLFYASDISVARDRFVAHRFANKLWGLPAYYAGQLLIAWSLA